MGEMTYIEKTQNTLGKVIQRPTLSEKNLSRPPFRFIHDIMTQLIKKTGFFKDLFPPEMLDSKNVTEKDQKVKFLQAIIACTTLVYGKEISVKASSIVSGKEPENTNKLLQIIGKCILDKKSSDEAVEQLKNGGKKTEKESKPKEESIRKEKEPSQEKEERRKSKSEQKPKHDTEKPKKHKSDEKSSSKREGSSRHRESSKPRTDNSKDRKSDRRDRDRSNDKKSKSDDKENRESDRKSKRDKSEKRSKETPEEREARKEAEREERRRQRKIEKSGRPPRPTSAKGDRRTAHVPEDQKQPVEQEETPARKMRERPTSARPAKRVKAPVVEEIVPQVVVNPNVIIDENDDEEDENDLGFDEQIDLGSGTTAGVTLNENDYHGALVQDIIDSKNKIEKNSQKSSRSVMSEAEETKHKKRIEKIRSEIQQISRTAAPIGRVLDFIQEDMDSMENEFEEWTQELTKNQNIIQQGAKQNDVSLQSLFDQLDQLDAEILSKRNEINSTKQKIYFNKNMIEKQVKMMLT